MDTSEVLVTENAALEQPQTVAELNQKIDILTEQVAFLAEHAADQQRRQREWDELKADLTPIINEAFMAAVEELAEIEPHVRLEDLLHLLKRLARNTRNIENMFDQLESLTDLIQDVTPIFNEAFITAITQLDQMERKGYFDAMREGLYVVDNIIESFGPEDVHQLGDNVVTILTTVKEMTQPEVMETVQNLTQTMRQVEAHPEQIDTSMFGIMRQLRDPEIRRGLALTMQMLKSIGEQNEASKQ